LRGTYYTSTDILCNSHFIFIRMVEPSNALLDSIYRKGEHSYYYAHAPKQTEDLNSAHRVQGEGIIHGGPPQLIQVQEVTPAPQPRVVNIRNFSWADEDDECSVYITFPSDILQDAVSFKSDLKSFEFSYRLSELETHKLIKKLSKTIDPDRSKLRLRKNKATITLYKSEPGKWDKLEE
jgi:predicted dehydrogenase